MRLVSKRLHVEKPICYRAYLWGAADIHRPAQWGSEAGRDVSISAGMCCTGELGPRRILSGKVPDS